MKPKRKAFLFFYSETNRLLQLAASLSESGLEITEILILLCDPEVSTKLASIRTRLTRYVHGSQLESYEEHTNDRVVIHPDIYGPYSAS